MLAAQVVVGAICFVWLCKGQETSNASALHFLPLHTVRKLLQVADALGVLAVVGVVSLAKDKHHQLVAVDLRDKVSQTNTASARGRRMRGRHHSVAVGVKLEHQRLQLLLIVVPNARA